MSGEIYLDYEETGVTLYATIQAASSRQMWNGSALEALTVANWGDYDIALTETPASSYFYVGNWPAGLTTAGWYYVQIYKQAGGSPAIGDKAERKATLYGYWNGTKFEVAGADVGQWQGAVPSGAPAVQGDEMDLVDAPNALALAAIGAKVEAMVLDEGDATALLAAIAAKIEEFLINEGDATATMAAIAAAVNAGTVGTNIGTILTRLGVPAASVSADIAAVKAETAEILTDTGTTLPAAIDAIPTAAEIDTELTTQHGEGSWQHGIGSGGGAWTVNITVTDGSDPISGAYIRLTAGVLSYLAVTDALGVATFNVDEATYTVAATRAGYTYGGSTLDITGDTDAEIEMTPQDLSAPDDPALCRVTGYTRTGAGVAEAGVDVEFMIDDPPASTGSMYSREVLEVTSDDDGVYTIDLPRSGRFKYRRTTIAQWSLFTVDDADTMEGPTL